MMSSSLILIRGFEDNLIFNDFTLRKCKIIISNSNGVVKLTRKWYYYVSDTELNALKEYFEKNLYTDVDIIDLDPNKNMSESDDDFVHIKVRDLLSNTYHTPDKIVIFKKKQEKS